MIEASVIISTYNRASCVLNCLDALCHQNQSADCFEVILVIDGSTDNTINALASYSPPYRLRVIYQSNQGQSEAFNQAMKVAEGKIIIFLDDDITPVPEFVSEHLRLHQTKERAIGIGQITNTIPLHSDWFSRHFNEEWRTHYSQLNNGLHTPDWQDCFCGNMSVQKDAFQKTGGFSKLPRGNDIEMAYRLTQNGYTPVYLPDASGDQYEQKGFRQLISDSERSGVGCVEIYHKHPATLQVTLGRFSQQNPRMAAILRILLFLNIPPARLGLVGWFINKISGSNFAYHLLQRYAYWRGVRRSLTDQEDWQNIVSGIPILMYHAFGTKGEPPSRYIMPIDHFDKQMAWLSHRRYRVISLYELLRYREESRMPPGRSVVITIDDGYADTMNLAFPILKKYGFTATVFLVASFVGGKNEWDHQNLLYKRDLLSWDDILELQQEGITFGSHSCTHPNLLSVPLEVARNEIRASREIIQSKLGKLPNAFSYPFGIYNSDLENILKDCGYRGGCTVNYGLNTISTNTHSLRRVEIYGTDTLLQYFSAIKFGGRSKWLLERFLNLLLFE